MSTNFSSNQFNSAFLPCHLQNYAIPRKFKEFPTQRRSCTTVIADNHGHILPKFHSQRSKSAWGHFMGTWQQPKKPVNVRIKTKLMVRGLNGMPEGFGTTKIRTDVMKDEPNSADRLEEASVLLGSSSSNDSVTRHTISRESVRSDKTPSVTGVDSPLPPQSRTSSAGGRSATAAATSSRSSSACSIHSSAGCTPYTHQGGLTPGSPSSEHTSSLNRGPPSDSNHLVKLPSLSASQTNSSGKPMCSRVLSAPVQTRSSSLSKTVGRGSESLNSAQSSRLHSPMISDQHGQYSMRPDSSQQSIASMIEEGDETCTYYSHDSRASSRASIASTTSTKSGVKCRGVQCGSLGKLNQ